MDQCLQFFRIQAFFINWIPNIDEQIIKDEIILRLRKLEEIIYSMYQENANKIVFEGFHAHYYYEETSSNGASESPNETILKKIDTTIKTINDRYTNKEKFIKSNTS